MINHLMNGGHHIGIAGLLRHITRDGSRKKNRTQNSFSFLRSRAIKCVIARSETRKQSPFVRRWRLLRYARNDTFDRDFHPTKLNLYSNTVIPVDNTGE